jgi:hypothetical protein
LFALTVFAYPLVLALLCLGAGLAVDRSSGRFLPDPLLPAVGAAALIALSQLSTWIVALAPATPYLMLALALLGFALAGPSGARDLLARLRLRWWALSVPLFVYLLALAPVLLSGRAGFSSFMALSDSALHMIGADYLIQHGQSYAHLDLRNSYGQFIRDYYASGYPSGADTLFGGSAQLLHLSLLWTFQPFCGLVLALGSGPAWAIARRFGLSGGWACLAALSATVPALLYGYELIGSVKELAAVLMLLTLGALVVLHPRWLLRSPRHALPSALVLAGGVSALGVGFGVWALVFACVLLLVLAGELRRRPAERRRLAGTLLLGGLALLLAAWPTWMHISQSLNVAQAISSTANPGNLQTSLKWAQAFGVWLHASYKESPSGLALALTDVLIVLAGVGCLLGALQLLRLRRFALGAWIALTLLAWLVLSASATTWVDAKALVLTSPVLVLLAWGGVAALLGDPSPSSSAAGASERMGGPAARRARPSGRRSATRGRGARRPPLAGLAAVVLALGLVGGAVASDLVQYHSSNLAPTARYEELASIGKRFAGRGPALFTDFDEYSMYALRRLDLGGPDFVYPPPALASLAAGYGRPVRLQRASPRALAAYPLIITRRDPSATPPPGAYRLAEQGAYYQVWLRRPAAPVPVSQLAARGTRALSCPRVLRAVRRARARGLEAVGVLTPQLVHVRLRRAHLPKGWGRRHGGFTMRRAGSVSLHFAVPHAGVWDLWLQGQFMPDVRLAVDRRPLATLSGQLAGNSLVPDTATPLPVRLATGSHRLDVARGGFSLAPGNGGSAVLDAAFLTPAGAPARVLRSPALDAAPRALCAQPYRSIELVPRVTPR